MELREAAQMALNAMLNFPDDISDDMFESIKALRAALTQPEQEPVAWLCKNKKNKSLFALTQEQLYELGYGNISMPAFEKVAPLYGHKLEKKLWLWKNFVDGKPEYWAFDNPYPTNLDNGDPQTLGQPCGYAIFKPSRDGSCGRTEEQVLREMKSVTAPPQREWQGLTDEEMEYAMPYAHSEFEKNEYREFASAIEAKLREKNFDRPS